MTNEELMQLMTDMGLHEGGIENWVPDNAWLRVANAVEERERNKCVTFVQNWTGGGGKWECAKALKDMGKVEEHKDE